MKIIVSILKNLTCEVEVPETYTILELKKQILQELNLQYDSAFFNKTRIIYQKKIIKNDETLTGLKFYDGINIIAKLPANANLTTNSLPSPQTSINQAAISNPNSSSATNNLNTSFPQISTQQNSFVSNQTPSLNVATATNSDLSFPQISTQQNIAQPSQPPVNNMTNLIAFSTTPNNDFSFPQISTQQRVIPTNQPPPYNMPNSMSSSASPNNDFSFPQISTQQRVIPPSQPPQYNIPNPMPSSAAPNNDFSFPQISTQQRVIPPNQPPPYNMPTNNYPISQIPMPQPTYSSSQLMATNQGNYPTTVSNSMMDFMGSFANRINNVDPVSLENNVSQLVSQGFPERGARNALRILGNDINAAYNALCNGLFLEEKTNKLIEELMGCKLSPEKRREVIQELTRETIEKVYNGQSQEDKQYQLQNAYNRFNLIQHGFQQMTRQNMINNATPMIQHSNLSQQEIEILPILRSALAGMGNPDDNPFALYISNSDDSQFQSEELFNDFLKAADFKDGQWKFIAKCLLSNIPISTALFYLECTENDPVRAEALLASS